MTNPSGQSGKPLGRRCEAFRRNERCGSDNARSNASNQDLLIAEAVHEASTPTTQGANSQLAPIWAPPITPAGRKLPHAGKAESTCRNSRLGRGTNQHSTADAAAQIDAGPVIDRRRWGQYDRLGTPISAACAGAASTANPQSTYE